MPDQTGGLRRRCHQILTTNFHGWRSFDRFLSLTYNIYQITHLTTSPPAEGCYAK